MRNASRSLVYRVALIAAGLATSSTGAFGQVESVTISEPAIVKIGDLFKQADVVAIVKILSGDSAHYATTVYKTEVLTAFKGTRSTERLYFGPFISYGVGSEYLVFLRRSKDELSVSRNLAEVGVNYGQIRLSYQVMYDGYSVMPARYACVFEEKGSKQPCDDGIKVNTHQVTLPKTLKTYPTEPADADMSDAKWVRRSALLSVLDALRPAQ